MEIVCKRGRVNFISQRGFAMVLFCCGESPLKGNGGWQVDLKHALQRHYCSICQNVFCHHHTAYSPHGKLGSCGMESKCVCESCFSQLSRSTQARLCPTLLFPSLCRRYVVIIKIPQVAYNLMCAVCRSVSIAQTSCLADESSNLRRPMRTAPAAPWTAQPGERPAGLHAPGSASLLTPAL